MTNGYSALTVIRTHVLKVVYCNHYFRTEFTDKVEKTSEATETRLEGETTQLESEIVQRQDTSPQTELADKAVNESGGTRIEPESAAELYRWWSTESQSSDTELPRQPAIPDFFRYKLAMLSLFTVYIVHTFCHFFSTNLLLNFF